MPPQLEQVLSRDLIAELLARADYGVILVALPTGEGKVRISRYWRWEEGYGQECLGAVTLLCQALGEALRAREVPVEPMDLDSEMDL